MRALPQDQWLNKRVLVTGGAGFLASFIIDTSARSGAGTLSFRVAGSSTYATKHRLCV